MYYVTVLSNWILGYDQYRKTYSKDLIPESTFPDKFYLVDIDNLDIGINKAKKLLTKLNVVYNRIIYIKTNVSDTIHSENGRGFYINQNFIPVESVYIYDTNTWGEDDWFKLDIEDATALSWKLQPKTNANPVPRSFSWLPVAKACQADCKFCFSESSISFDKKKMKCDLELLNSYLIKSKQAGATRFVITGGGEPTLIGLENINLALFMAKDYFKKTVLITNGIEIFDKKNTKTVTNLIDLKYFGLDTLSISRHHWDDDLNGDIMGYRLSLDDLKKIIYSNRMGIDIPKIRLICVLQKEGIHDAESIQEYISYAKSLGINEICFKELYVASSHESMYAKSKENIYSRDNRVDLKVLIDYLENNNATLIHRLPWGSPVYELDGVKIAAYTEPTLGWEIHNNVCRSWNLMADGKCYWTLETMDSEIK